MLSRFGPIIQNAFVVPDLQRAIHHWTRVLNVGPFFVFEHVNYGGVQYRGLPTMIDASVGMSIWGNIQIELIEQHNDAPSIYRDFLCAGRRGMHHMAVLTTSYQEQLAGLAREGIVPIQSGGEGIGTRFCYVETDSTVGWMIELIEATKQMREVTEEIAAAVRKWDGGDSIRKLG